MKQNGNNNVPESQEVNVSEPNLTKTESSKKRGSYTRKIHSLLRLYSALYEFASESEDGPPLTFTQILEKMRTSAIIFSSDDPIPNQKNLNTLLSDPDVFKYFRYVFPHTLELTSNYKDSKTNDKQVPRGVLDLELGNPYHTFPVEHSVKNEETPTDKSSTNLVRLVSPIRSSTWRFLFDALAACPGIPKSQAEDQIRYLRRYALGNPSLPMVYPKPSGNNNLLEILFSLSKVIRDNRKYNTTNCVDLTIGSYVFSETHHQPILEADFSKIKDAQPIDFAFVGGRYYVIFIIQDQIKPIPADRITAVTVVSLKKLSLKTSVPPRRPYIQPKSPLLSLYPEQNQMHTVLIRCHPDLLDQAVIAFPGITLRKTRTCKDGLIEFRAENLPHQAAVSFALQHLSDVEIIQPASVRDEVTAILAQAQKKYSATE